MSKARELIERLKEQGCFTSDLRIEQAEGCTCARSETETPGLTQYEWDKNCPAHGE